MASPATELSTAAPSLASGRTSLGAGLAVGSAVAFGATGPFAKSLIEAGWTPETVVGVRILGAALVLTPFGLRALLANRERLGRSDAISMLAYGVVGLAGIQICFFNALARLPVSVALLIEYIAPVLLVVGAGLRTRTLPPRLVVAGAACATLGLIPVLDLRVAGGIDPMGVLWALAAALCLCGYFLLVAGSGAHVPQTLLIWAGCGTGSAVIALSGLVGVLRLHVGATDVVLAGHSTSWLVPALCLIVLSTVVAYLGGMVAIRILGNRRASFIALTEVLFAALASWLLLGQTLTAVQIGGAVVVVAGVLLVQLGSSTGPEA